MKKKTKYMIMIQDNYTGKYREGLTDDPHRFWDKMSSQFKKQVGTRFSLNISKLGKVV